MIGSGEVPNVHIATGAVTSEKLTPGAAEGSILHLTVSSTNSTIVDPENFPWVLRAGDSMTGDLVISSNGSFHVVGENANRLFLLKRTKIESCEIHM